MNFLLFLILLLFQVSLLANSISSPNETLINLYSRDWKSYKTKYAINERNPLRDLFRFKIYDNNLKRISRFNSNKNSSFKLKANKFTHLSDLERQTYLTRINMSDLKKSTRLITQNRVKLQNVTNLYARLVGSQINSKTPAKRGMSSSTSWLNINWANYGYITPVEDQGACGACYAFTAVNLNKLISVRVFCC